MVQIEELTNACHKHVLWFVWKSGVKGFRNYFLEENIKKFFLVVGLLRSGYPPIKLSGS